MKHSKTGLFLMELIIGILFFSLASAICIEIFVKAHLMNNESVQKSHAVKIASNIVEIYKNDEFNSYFKKDKKKIYFNEKGEEASLKEATYTALIQETKQKMIVTIMCHNKTIYTLEYQHYQQRKF